MEKIKSAPTDNEPKRERIFILNETILRTSPTLACEIGLNESMMLLQIDFWISIANNFHEGRYWTYQSTRDVQAKAFPFWSLDTINRTINKLISKQYVVVGNFNKAHYDRTRWFALNVDKLSELKSIAIKKAEIQPGSATTQNRTRSNQNRTHSSQNHTTIPKNTTENTTENTSIILNNINSSPGIPESFANASLSGTLDDEVLDYVQTIVDYFNGLKGRYPTKIRSKITRPVKLSTVDKYKEGKYRTILKWYKQSIPVNTICDLLQEWIPTLKTNVGGSLNYFENKVINYISPERQTELDAYRKQILEEAENREDLKFIK